MPLTVRAKGVSISTATNWAFNFFVGMTTPYLQELVKWRLYPMHGFYCICSFVLVYFCERYISFSLVILSDSMYEVYPETKGVPLEEMDALFGEGTVSPYSWGSTLNEIML